MKLGICRAGLPALICMASHAAPSWVEAPALSVPPAELLKAAAGMPVLPQYIAAELLLDLGVTLDEAGRRSLRYHYIYRVDQEAAIQGLGTVSAGWSTWFEEKPVIRARVITPDGVEHLLDPATLGESQPQVKDADMFSDRKGLRGPLPSLVKGALVEVEITQREFRVFSAAGNRGSLDLGANVPLAHSRFTLEAPAGSGLRWKLEGLPETALTRTEAGGRVRITVEAANLEAAAVREPMEPNDVESTPHIKWTTTPSWKAVAEEYLDIVKAQTKDADLKAVAAAATAGAKDRATIIDRVLAYVQKRVRYAGLEFGEASIVPRRPADVLERGYGDCKDKACLVASLLEALGIEAKLALLRSTPIEGVDFEMPGLSLFDHVIVYLPGKEPLWIDATARQARAGLLPTPDQGKLALVVARGSRNLLRTPETPAEANVTLRTCDVILADEGPGRITDTVDVSGPGELMWRSGYGSADPTKLREFLATHAAQTYKGEGIEAVELRDPDDLARPFQLRYDILKAGVAFTATRDASVSMNPATLVNAFETILQGGEKPQGTRRTDLVIPEPYVLENRWILHPPVGYACEGLPENRTFTFGSSTLTYAFAGRPDGAVEATFRFTCSQRRWTAAQVTEARKALATFRTGKVPAVVFQHKGEDLLSAGKTPEALAEFRRLMDLQKGQPGPYLRLARAQLAAGLGDSARASAQRAVELKPDAAFSHATLAWILQHDPMGRRFKPGWDRAGSVKAYREAIRLEPEARHHRYNLAVLLEHDENGIRYLSGDLKEAMDIYRALDAKEKNETIEENLVACLAKTGQLEEAMELVRPRQGAARWDAWYIALNVRLKGIQPALAQATQDLQDAAVRRQALRTAGDWLVQMRQYADASTLLREGAPGAEQVTQILGQAENIARIHPADTSRLTTRDPKSTVLLFFSLVFDVHPDMKKLRGLLEDGMSRSATDEELLAPRNMLMSLMGARGIPAEGLRDSLLSFAEVSVDGTDAKGYLAQAQCLTGRMSLFLIREKDGYRIAGLQGNWQDMAHMARELLARGDLKSAAVWLERAQDQMPWKMGGGDIHSGHPVFRLWVRTHPGGLQDASVATAALLAYNDPDASTMATLRAAFDRSKDGFQRYAIAQALLSGMVRRGEFRDFDLIMNGFRAASPDTLSLAWARAFALEGAGRWEELLESATRSLRAHQGDNSFIKARLLAMLHLGRYKEAETLLLGDDVRTRLTPDDAIQVAWTLAEEGRANDRTVDLARKGPADSPTAQRVLALVLADRGRTLEARETLQKAMTLAWAERPTREDWYVYGRIAEKLGDAAEARVCYQRVVDGTDRPSMAMADCVQRAAARLRKLGKA